MSKLKYPREVPHVYISQMLACGLSNPHGFYYTAVINSAIIYQISPDDLVREAIKMFPQFTRFS